MDRERLRANHAFAFAAGDFGKEKAAQVLSRVRELPSMLQTNGLLATWAFYLASGDKNGYAPVAETVLSHLKQAGAVAEEDRGLDEHAIFAERWLAAPDDRGPSGAELRKLTAEAIAYAVWLKRAGEALLSGHEGAAEAGDASGPAEAPPPAAETGGDAGAEEPE